MMDKYKHHERKKPKPDPKRRCHRCHGSGQATCVTCGGQGRVLKGKDRLGREYWIRFGVFLGAVLVLYLVFGQLQIVRQ